MCWCVNTAPNNRWCTLKAVWHKGPIHTHYWSTSYVLFAAFFQDHSVEIFMWNKASHRGPSSPVWTLSGTALSTGSDLGHPFGLEQSRGWPALRSLAWTGGNNQPATRTASPLFFSLGTWAVYDGCCFHLLQAHLLTSPDTVPSLCLLTHFFRLAVSPICLRDSRTMATCCTCSAQVSLWMMMSYTRFMRHWKVAEQAERKCDKLVQIVQSGEEWLSLDSGDKGMCQ